MGDDDDEFPQQNVLRLSGIISIISITDVSFAMQNAHYTI
jgi:hypothetical protein